MLAVVVALPMLYIFSIGPVSYIFEASSWCRRRTRLTGAAAMIYIPLKPLFTHEYLGPPFRRYIGWWDDLARAPTAPDPFPPAAQDGADPFAQDPK